MVERLQYINILKNTRAYDEITRDFAANRASHAYMLCCEDGELAFEFAMLIAAMHLCSEVPPCLHCRSCANVFKGVHPDVAVYPQANDVKINVEDVESIIETSYLSSVESDKKVFVLKNMSKMLPQAQNKLLKILEEPPRGVLFILLAEQPMSVLTTVRSRTAELTLERLSSEVIFSYLSAKYGDNRKCRALSVVCGGNISLAEKMLADDEYYEIYEDMFRLMKGFDHSSKILGRAKLLLKHEKKLSDALMFLNMVLRDALVLRADDSLIKNVEKIDDVREIAALYPDAALIAAIGLVERAKQQLQFNCGKKAVVDNLLISILEERRKCLI